MAYAVLLQGELQTYDWGRKDGLSAWTGRRTGGPEAELWFGTHALAPSRVLASIPEGSARHAAAPLLVKLLAAQGPLSIQVHPSHRSIELLDGHGYGALLADTGEKAEMLVALERFDVLAGFRPPRVASRILRTLGIAPAADLLERGEIANALSTALRWTGHLDHRRALAELSPAEQDIMTVVLSAFPGDPGLPVAFMMQPYALEPNDAVCIPAGTVHAYVGGLGVEVMPSCDNVLRLGLTRKTVSVDASLLALDPTAEPVILSSPDATGTYACPALPFEVTRLEAGRAVVGQGAIGLALAGRLTLSSAAGTLEARSGRALLIEGAGPGTLETTGVAFVARPRTGTPVTP